MKGEKEMPNLLLIVIVILIAFFLLFQFIKKRKTEQVEENIEVDDKTYTLEKNTFRFLQMFRFQVKQEQERMSLTLRW